MKTFKEFILEAEVSSFEEGIGMTIVSALGNPPLLSKRMKLKQALIIGKINKDTKENKKKHYSGRAALQSEEHENVQELFITRMSPEKRKKKKIEDMKNELVRLIRYADDPHSDVAPTRRVKNVQ